MDASRRARDAALGHVEDVTPQRLGTVIEDRLREASMVPGVLTLLSASAVAPSSDVRPDDHAPAIDRRAAGVQLIYEGLALTRTLVTDNSWEGVTEESPSVPADIDVLAADVFVARGFSLLARTDAAPLAVETVRAFGRARTDRLADRPPSARRLEANVFELAAVAGATAVTGSTPRPLRQYAVGLARANPDTPLAPAEELLPETVEDVLERVGATRNRRRPRPQSPD